MAPAFRFKKALNLKIEPSTDAPYDEQMHRLRRPSRSPNCLTASLVAILLSLGIRSHADITLPTELDDQKLKIAIEALVNSLLELRLNNNTWENSQDTGTQAGGDSAFALLALCFSGQSHQHQALKPALDALLSRSLRGTYAIAARCQLLAQLPNSYQKQMQQDVHWLIKTYDRKNNGWAYTREQRSGYVDMSLRHFGALALWEASRRGAKIPIWLWESLAEGTLQWQLNDGSWNYKKNGPGTGSMTAAGCTILLVIRDVLSDKAIRQQKHFFSQRLNNSIDRGLTWLDQHYTVDTNPNKGTYRSYYLYALERVALLSGRRTIGLQDWFRQGASALLNNLGSFSNDGLAFSTDKHAQWGHKTRLREYAFALLFLSRGSAPIAIAKLQDESVAWNLNPGDVRRMTSDLSSTLEDPMHWQTVDIKSDTEAWLESSLLVASMDKPSHWIRAAQAVGKSMPVDPHMEEQRKKIQYFLQRGGLLLVIDQSQSGEIRKALLESLDGLYPGSAWSTPSTKHWLYTQRHKISGSALRCSALESGVRTLIIVARDDDLNCDIGGKAGIRARYLVRNLYLYASEMHQTKSRLHKKPDATGVKLPRLVHVLTVNHHDAESNSEPLAMEYHAHLSKQHFGHTIIIKEMMLEELADSDTTSLVVVRGIQPRPLNTAELTALSLFTQRGGTVLFETVGGQGSFARATETMLEHAWNKRATVLPRNHFINRTLKETGHLQHLYRPSSLNAGFGTRSATCSLRCFKVGEQERVFFSNEDLSFALLDQNRSGIHGYTHNTARAILETLFAYAYMKK
ncbi:MAG: hypothetical protein P8J86_06810 [Phycisphaerales bacterium]|nr:hypothetical protein [Phycisphaerales bacterium]